MLRLIDSNWSQITRFAQARVVNYLLLTFSRAHQINGVTTYLPTHPRPSRPARNLSCPPSSENSPELTWAQFGLTISNISPPPPSPRHLFFSNSNPSNLDLYFSPPPYILPLFHPSFRFWNVPLLDHAPSTIFFFFFFPSLSLVSERWQVCVFFR